MAYTNCPKCEKRLVVPQTSSALSLRCPACKHVFNTGPSPEAADETDKPEAPAETPAEQKDGDGFDFALGSQPRILSAADEAMLRDLGSGSGLLELTREALELQAGERSRGALAPPSDQPPGDLSDRQFQVVGTALTMANRLVEVYKAELARSRRLALTAWIAVAAIALSGIVTFWWGMSKSGSADVERSTAASERSAAASLKNDLADEKANVLKEEARTQEEKLRTQEEKAKAVKLSADLDAARNDDRKTQADLSKTKDELSKARQDLTKSQADLESANVRTSDLESQLNWMRTATTSPATRPN